MYICYTPWELHTSSLSANVLSFPHLKPLPLPLHLVLQIPLPPHSPLHKLLGIKAPSGSKNAKAGSKSLISKASATMASTRSSPNCIPFAPGLKRRALRVAACWYTAALACPGARQ